MDVIEQIQLDALQRADDASATIFSDFLTIITKPRVCLDPLTFRHVVPYAAPRNPEPLGTSAHIRTARKLNGYGCGCIYCYHLTRYIRCKRAGSTTGEAYNRRLVAREAMRQIEATWGFLGGEVNEIKVLSKVDVRMPVV